MVDFILTDIEGTTTSVAFVYDTLFPYFSAHLPDFVDQHADDVEVQAILAETLTQPEAHDLEQTEEAVAALIEWTKKDLKIPVLKKMQGLVWKNGYEEGQIKGHVYADVLPNLEKWQKQGCQFGIYSSGSVAAQKLLFGYSIFGDLRPFFSHYFDTAIGAKREENAYRRIQNEIGRPAHQILFLSDVEAELDAARAAGMKTTQLVREGTVPSPKHPQALTFDDIQLDSN
ncbi:MAG: acireductone synthase [Microscillaceae bacterium]